MTGCEGAIYSVSAIDEDFPVIAKDIGKATALDPLLSRVLDFFMTGWPEKCDEVEEELNHVTFVVRSFPVNKAVFCGALE